MPTHTSAIVLRTVDYQESSKIVTLLTSEHGKMAVIVKGAKRIKSKFSGLLEPGNVLDVVYYYKPGRSVQTLSEASFEVKNTSIRRDFEKLAVLTSSIELIGQLVHEGEINKPVFEFTCRFIHWLEEMDESPKNIFPYLQIRLADLMGLGLQLLPAGNENSGKIFFLNIETGTVSATNDNHHSLPLTQNQFDYVQLAIQARNSRLLQAQFEPGERKELVNHLDQYLKFHMEGLRDRKSDLIFEQLLQD